MTAAEPTKSSGAEATARHIKAVEAILNQHGIPAEYNENHAADEDLYRMAMFKILPCPKNTQHDWSCCPYAHTNERARRRSLMVHLYYTKVCPDMQNTGECPRGEACAMTHSMFEYWMHPQRYRTKLCREGTKCTRSFCFFAHTQEQLREGADEPTGMQLLQAFLPRRTSLGCVTSLPTAAFAASSNRACRALPPLPDMQASRGVEHGRLAVSTLQQQQQHCPGQQFMVLSSANSGCQPFFPACSSTCSASHNNSSVASSSSCASAVSTVQLQAGMSLLGSSSSGVWPSNSLGPSATVAYQPQQLQLVEQGHALPAQQVYGQCYGPAADSLAVQLQQLQLGSEPGAISIDQAPAAVTSATMVVMPRQHTLQSAVATGCLQSATSADLHQVGMHLVQPSLQQQQQLILEQQHAAYQQQQQQQQQLVILQSASSGCTTDNTHIVVMNGASPGAVSIDAVPGNQRHANQPLSWRQGFELVLQGSTGSTDPQQMPVQAVQQSAVWLGQQAGVPPSGAMQQQIVAVQAPTGSVHAWGI